MRNSIISGIVGLVAGALIGATVVTSTRIPEEAVYGVVESVFENFDVFKTLHPGALRYYREAGLL